MRNGNRKQFWLNLLILVTILVIVISDIITKEWIRSFPPDGATILKVWFFRIIHITNTGSAFGAFQGYSLVLAIIAVIGLFVLSGFGIFIYRKIPAIRQYSEQDCARFDSWWRPREPD